VRKSHGIVTLIILLQCASTAYSQKLDLPVTISGLRSDMGLIRLGLYDHPEQFPNDPLRSFTFEKTSLVNGVIKVVLKGLVPGEYAITLLDDEDENNQMNYKLLRIPREGYGFSNNIKPGLKCPPYKKCTFWVDTESRGVEIEMQYFSEEP
jgi:uncharacterized protein (DUF2141 family)